MKIKLNQGALLTVTPKDGNGGPTTVIGNSMQAISSNLAAMDNAFLDPPNQSEVGRTAYTMRAKQHGKVGDTGRFDITAQAFTGTPTPGPVVKGSVDWEIVAADGPNIPPLAVKLDVVLTPVPQP